MITANSWEELLDRGLDCVIGDMQPHDIKIGNLLLFVRICGKSWDGSIDYRGANYIIELQDAITRIYHELSEEDDSLRNVKKFVTVKMKVVDGSSLFEINVGEALGRMVEKLSGKQTTFIATVAILSAVGYFSQGKYLDYMREKENSSRQGQIAIEVIEKMRPMLERSAAIIETAELEKPARALVATLDPDDNISFPEEESLSAAQAKLRYPRKPISKPKTGIFDDTYTVTNIGLRSVLPEFTLEKDGFQFKAEAELSSSDIDKLASQLKAALTSGDELTVPLQVFIQYNKRGIKSASITSIGEKREGAKGIQDLIAMY